MMLILNPLALGCQHKNVAAALDIRDVTLSRMLPKGFTKEMNKMANHRSANETETV